MAEEAQATLLGPLTSDLTKGPLGPQRHPPHTEPALCASPRLLQPLHLPVVGF